MVTILPNTPPFALDEILARYLSNLDDEYDEKYQDKVKHDTIAGKDKFLVSRFLPNEDITHDTETRFVAFKEYFEKHRILKFYPYSKYWDKYYSNSNNTPIRFKELHHPYQLYEYELFLVVQILDIDGLREFRKKYSDYEEVGFSSTTSKVVRGDDVIHDNGWLFFKTRSYKPTSKIRRAIIKTLWPNRKQKGRNSVRLDVNHIARTAYNLDPSHNVSNSQLERLAGAFKGINSGLARKEIPYRIKNYQGNIQLVPESVRTKL